MLLAIDVGNTNTVLGVFDGRQAAHSWRIKTDARSTADELALTFRGLLGDTRSPGSRPARPSPPCCTSFASCSRRYYADLPTVIVEPGVRTGCVQSPTTRRRSAPTASSTPLAAHHLSTGPCIVVDFGTSTNFDVVSARGDFLGGALAPASRSRWMRSPPAPRTAQGRARRPASPIGKNTVESLQSGILYGFAGQVDGLVRRLAALEPDDPGGHVIATGGLATLVIEHCETVTRYEPDLTLFGLRLIYERNTEVDT